MRIYYRLYFEYIWCKESVAIKAFEANIVVSVNYGDNLQNLILKWLKLECLFTFLCEDVIGDFKSYVNSYGCCKVERSYDIVSKILLAVQNLDYIT